MPGHGSNLPSLRQFVGLLHRSVLSLSFTMLAVVLLLFALLVLLSVAYVRRQYSYWARRNVPHLQPEFPYGNFRSLVKKSPADTVVELYRQMDPTERFYGLFIATQPVIMITDLELIKYILIKDFNHFPDHGVYYNEQTDPLSAHLFCIEGDQWRTLRSKLTPTFTSGRMKAMFPILYEVSQQLKGYLSNVVGRGKELDMKECFARMTTDVIGSCAFGIDCNSFQEPWSQFRRSGQLVFDNPRHSQFTNMLLRLFPAIGHAFGVKVNHEEVIEFFTKLVRDTVSLREQSKTSRHDFMNLLIELKNGPDGISMDELTAQAFVFFAGGYETSSSNMTFCLYELALNPDIQEKVRASVLLAIKKHGGLTYEAINDMEYLDCCINETLRRHPALAMLQRKAAKEYQIPESDVVIPKGMKVLIPTYAIHYDSRYYEDPDRFDPERFTAAHQRRHVSTFLPFGEGPRICIGKRFGMMQSRTGLAAALMNFKFTVCPKTVVPLEYAVNSLTVQPKVSVWLHVEPLSENSK